MDHPITTAGAGPLFEVRGISKSFSGVHALTDVTLDFRAGEVLALVGENGAGKSTLLRILNGDHQPDHGELLLDGRTADFPSPREARAAGIRVIAQEPEIIPYVSVAENVYVGALPASARRFHRSGLRVRVQQDLERYGFDDVLDPDTLGSRLSPAQRQLVEILRALTTNPRILAFDEPTSSLSDAEVTALFRLIARLREDGCAIVYVSHRMREIFTVADRVAVLRDGRLVGTREIPGLGEPELVRMMVGRDLSAMFTRERSPSDDVVLSVRAVTTEDVRDISFDVHAGEVVALAGLVGAGRSELAKGIVGDVPLVSGEVAVRGVAVRLRSPRDAIDAGIGFAPEERKAEALLMDRSVRDNVSLAVLERLRRWRVINLRQERTLVTQQVERMRVRTPSVDQEVRKLSGGNQQKVVLARWLARRPQVLILDEPTRGVDVGAKAEIYAIIDELARDGMAVLVISSDMPEVLGLADRIVVLQGGRKTGELTRAEATEESILALALPHDTVSA